MANDVYDDDMEIHRVEFDEDEATDGVFDANGRIIDIEGYLAAMQEDLWDDE